MKRMILASAGVLFLGVASCGSDAKVGSSGSAGTSGGTAGTTGSGGSGTGGSGTGGTTGAGGDATGGTTGAGGSGTAGSSAGASGSAGRGGAVGSAGTGGSGTGTGGSGTAGGAGGSAGSGAAGTGNAGRGGSGTGGATGGSGGSGAGGTTGSGGSGGGSMLSVAAAWDGQLVTYPCSKASSSGYDCANSGCSNNMVTKMNSWTMAGTAATVYSVTFNVRGVVEAYAYVGGTRDGGSITSNLDLFQRGGMPQSSGGANYDYNTYELDVAPGVTGEANTYFLNSVMTSEGPHAANTPTSHLTFPINYTKTIKVMGNSVVTLKVFDSNCTLVMNCGATSGNTCANPRTVSLTGVMPPAPTTFTQPFQMPTGAFGQWVYFDVTDVTAN